MKSARNVSKVRIILIIVCLLPLSLYSQFIARHNMSSATYQSEFTKYVGQGYRLADVTGYSMNGQETYGAIWNKESGPEWTARHAMSEAEYQAAVNDQKAKGYRPGRISAFNVGGQVRFACIFHKPSGAWIAKHDLSSAAYQTEFTNNANAGYRLMDVCGYTKGGQERYAAVWEKNNLPANVARHSMSAAQYQTEFNTLWGQGYRPVRISGFEVNGADQYAAIWEKVNTGVYARHGMGGQVYQAEFDNSWYQGATLKQMVAYSVGGKPLFAAIWNGGGLSGNDLSFIDSKVKKYMDDSDIPGLSIAVMKNGRLVFAKGYGKANKTTGEIVSPNSLFRIASVSKPITATAIMNLVEENKLNLSDKLFGPGGILGNPCAVAGACIDKADLEKITVQTCLEHSTGYTSDGVWQNYDMNNSEILAWVNKNYDQPTSPGVKYNYNNWNYFLLARVIEKKSGQTYQNYVKSAILSKCGITKMQIGSDTEAGNAPNEVTYYGGNPYNLHLTRMDGNGGWIARPIDLLMFMSGVDKENNRPDVLGGGTINTMLTPSMSQGAGDYAKGWKANGNWYMHNGCMTGTLAHLGHFDNGVSVAITINTRPANDECHWNGMYPLAKAIAESSITWPNYNLF